MNVRQLIKMLSGYDGDMPVVVASDAEGNGTPMLSDVGHSAMTDDGELVHPDDVADHEDDELTQVVVLWPA